MLHSWLSCFWNITFSYFKLLILIYFNKRFIKKSASKTFKLLYFRFYIFLFCLFVCFVFNIYIYIYIFKLWHFLDSFLFCLSIACFHLISSSKFERVFPIRVKSNKNWCNCFSIISYFNLSCRPSGTIGRFISIKNKSKFLI